MNLGIRNAFNDFARKVDEIADQFEAWTKHSLSEHPDPEISGVAVELAIKSLRSAHYQIRDAIAPKPQAGQSGELG